ncbi:tyrosine-protein phosphatase [Thalassorhabdomicrobium marinisediminis]|uniref:Protein tyrosine phosphatase n=1 Tax=Thalassorhabdomicrobium marinisediminis TaxID=2170577 RepID=A0A2T7FX07_9RHOB|nr:tyrosine-protein phosphatase [Thalassorhabdomicrobium marinisediminis]PVA06712.1 protein tyrosine phosphatase [Thalassorhabdomicrobium marinisediminis]
MSRKPPAFDLSTFRGRLAAWVQFLFVDHHLLRLFWWNLHQIAPGVWRSNQPGPRRLARYKAMGITSVVTLRADKPIAYTLLEAEACAALGLNFVNLRGVTARRLVEAETILQTIDAMAQVPRPFVFHCKSGADRTGFIAALFLILVEGVPVADAAGQLAARHFHFNRTRSGVLDHIFRVYLRDVEPGGQGFRNWLETGYNPKMIKADFNDWRAGAGRWAD